MAEIPITEVKNCFILLGKPHFVIVYNTDLSFLITRRSLVQIQPPQPQETLAIPVAEDFLFLQTNDRRVLEGIACNIISTTIYKYVSLLEN